MCVHIQKRDLHSGIGDGSACGKGSGETIASVVPPFIGGGAIVGDVAAQIWNWLKNVPG